MRLVTLTDGGLMFVMTNKDLKAVKKGPHPMSMNVVHDDKNVKFSFTTDAHFDAAMKRAETQLAQANKAVKGASQHAEETIEKQAEETPGESGMGETTQEEQTQAGGA